MSVCRILKKNEIKPWLKQRWCIGSMTSEYIWNMENVLTLYEQPYDPKHPVASLLLLTFMQGKE
jgi:hypothetical protein